MQNILVTVDAVLFFRKGKTFKVLLVKRKKDPFKGQWALPGGFLEEKETMEAGAKRELKEETGMEIENLRQIKAFGEPGRDPRGRTISIAFFGIAENEEKVKGADDASDARWHDYENLPALAFDHRQIIDAAYTLLKNSD